jgi:hypothetical protein
VVTGAGTTGSGVTGAGSIGAGATMTGAGAGAAAGRTARLAVFFGLAGNFLALVTALVTLRALRFAGAFAFLTGFLVAFFFGFEREILFFAIAWLLFLCDMAHRSYPK